MLLGWSRLKKLHTHTRRSFTGFLIAFQLVMGFSFLSASFLLFLVRERSEKAVLLQQLTGVHAVTFWAAAFAYDVINFVIPCVLTVVSMS